MLIVNFKDLKEQIENKIIEICSNLGTITSLPDYYTDTEKPKTITRILTNDKLYSMF